MLFRMLASWLHQLPVFCILASSLTEKEVLLICCNDDFKIE